MCHVSCVLFVAKNIAEKEIAGKRVIEIGACDENGSVRPLIESYKPAEYVGVDIQKGKSVDVICDAEELMSKFKPNSFDTVISTELLEHVRNWRKVVSNMKKLCKPNGLIIITTRSKGYPHHAAPYDYWRYEKEDMQKIFSDFTILQIEKDEQYAGIFIKAKKPAKFKEKDLNDYELYSIIANKRVKNIEEKHYKTAYYAKLKAKHKIKNIGRKALIKLKLKN